MNDIAQLGLKVDSSEAGIASSVLDKLTSSAKGTATSAELLQSGFTKLMLILGPAALAGAFATAISNAIKLQDQYVRLSEIAGTTASMMSAFDLPARLSGTSLDTVAQSIARLGKSIGEARLGDVQKQGLLRALGIDPNDGRDAAAIFVDLSKSLTTMKDQTIAGAASTQLLGRGFSELRPFMKEIVEQGGVHARVTDEQAAAAKRFEDQLTKLGFQLETSKIKLTEGLLPALNKIAEAFNKGYEEGGLFLGMIEAIQTTLTGDDAHKFNVEMTNAANNLLNAQQNLDAARATYQQTMAPFDADQVKRFYKEVLTAEAEVARLRAIKPVMFPEEAEKPKATEGAGGKTGSSEAEDRVKKLMEDQRLYDQRVAAAKGFADRYADAIKLQNTLAQEAHKQGLISDEDLIRQMGANEDAKLRVLAQSLEKQRALAEQKGDKGKAEEARQAAEQTNAAILANQAVTNAKVTSLQEVQDLEFKRSVAQRLADVQSSYSDERMLAEQHYIEKQNIADIARNIGLIDEQQWQIQMVQNEAAFQQELTRIADEETKKRFGISQVHRQLDLDAASTFFGNMSKLMQVKSKELFEIGKIAAIAEVTINTYKAAMGAYAALASIPIVGPALGAAAAAAAIAFGIAQVQQINSQSYGGKGGPSGGAVGTYPVNSTTGLPSSAPAAQQSSRPDTIIHLYGDTFGAEQVRDLVEHINENARDGGRIIVG